MCLPSTMFIRSVCQTNLPLYRREQYLWKTQFCFLCNRQSQQIFGLALFTEQLKIYVCILYLESTSQTHYLVMLWFNLFIELVIHNCFRYLIGVGVVDIVPLWATLQTEISITYSRGQLKVHRHYHLVGYTINRDINTHTQEGSRYIE